MEATNSQSTVSADAGIVAAAARLDYAVDLLGAFLVPVRPYATDDSGAVEKELADPLYSEWKDACTGSPIQPMSRRLSSCTKWQERLNAWRRGFACARNYSRCLTPTCRRSPIDPPNRPKRNRPECRFFFSKARALQKSGYTVATRTADSKKPNLVSWAKCLFLLVASRGIEPRTRGFSIQDTGIFPLRYHQET